MLDIVKLQREYFYDYATVIDRLIPENICDNLAERINEIIDLQEVDLVKHSSLGTDTVSDLGGDYMHHIFKGDDIRNHLPELGAIYHSLLPLISLITHTDAIVSPYPA